MPFLHLVNNEYETVFVRVVGNIDTQEVIRTMRRLGVSTKVPDNYNILIDLRASTRTRSYDDANDIINAYALAPGKYAKKVVFLATKSAYYGASRMTATLAEMKGYDAHAAKSEAQACQLLGIESLPSDDQFAREGFEV